MENQITALKQAHTDFRTRNAIHALPRRNSEYIKDSLDVGLLLDSIHSCTQGSLFFMDSSVLASGADYLVRNKKKDIGNNLLDKYATFYEGMGYIIQESNILLTSGVRSELNTKLVHGIEALVGKGSSALELSAQLSRTMDVVLNKEPAECPEDFYRRFYEAVARISHSEKQHVSALASCGQVDKKEIAAALWAASELAPTGLMTRDATQAGLFIELKTRMSIPALLARFNPIEQKYLIN